jgi:hypothetical protein
MSGSGGRKLGVPNESCSGRRNATRSPGAAASGFGYAHNCSFGCAVQRAAPRLPASEQITTSCELWHLATFSANARGAFIKSFEKHI